MSTTPTHFVVDATNTKTRNNWGFWSSGGGIDLVYNGVNVVYFPKSYVEKGFTTGTLGGYAYPTSGGYVYSSGNILWFGNGAFLNQNTWNYLKPAKLDQSLVNLMGPQTINPATYTSYWSVTGQTYQTAFDMRNVPDFTDGYILEKSQFDQLARSSANPSNSSDGRLFGWSPYRIPSGMGTTPDGNLSYVGYTTGGANDRRSDLYYINNSDSAKYGYMQYQWQDCGWFGCSFSDFLGSTLGQLILLGTRIYYPWFNLGYTAADFMFNDGKIGDLALAVVNLNMPTAGGTTPAAGTVFNIPQIASMGSKLAEFYTPYLGAEAAKAASFVTVNAGLNYLANGQNFEQAITTAAAQYVGNQAGAQVAKSLASFGTDVQKIMSATSTAVTKAALLNQDVEQAGLSAFVTTSIPLAVDGALKSANLTLSSNVKKTISDAAIQAALLPNANVDEILRSAAIGGLTRAVADKVSNDSVASKVIKSDDKAAMDKIFAYVGQYFSGRSVDEIVNSSIVNDALRATDQDIKEYSATMNGWANWDQFQTAQRLFGADVTPEFYDARVVSREKIIFTLQQEGVPESDWQNIIDFYEGVVGQDSTAADVLVDIRNFVNPLYMTGTEREYVTRAFSKLEEFDQEKYQAQYDQALAFAQRGQFSAVEEIANWVNQNYTSTNEAKNLWKEAFQFVGVDNYEPTQQQIDLIKGRNQIAAYTIAQHIAGERSVTFDATQFSNPKEAEEAARKANFNNFEFNDGIVYKVTTPINEALIRAEIEKQATYGDALGKARAELGPGKTFMYNGIQYTTNIAPTGVFDASMSSDLAQSAILAWSNKKDVFLARDGKIYTIPESVKTQLSNAVNQSPAETKRLLEQSLQAAPESYLNETARLLNYTGKGDMDWFSATKAMAMGTTLDGFAQFIDEGSKTFDLFRGNYKFDNSGVQLAKEINQLGQEQMPFGLDLQKYRFSVALNEVANEKDPYKQAEMFARAVNNNKMAFISIAGSEAVAEVPYIAAFVGASLALAPLGAGAVLLGGGAIAITSGIIEAAGTAGKNAYDAAIAQGDSEEVARNKAAQNATAASLIEMSLDFAANKFLLGSVAKNSMPSIMKAVGVGASNAAVGASSDFVQGYSQSIAEQLIVNPNTASANKAFADGMLEMTIGGTSRGALGIVGYALMPNTVIGKDYSGNNVTLNDVLLHDKVIDSSTVDPNVVVGRTGNNNSFTLGGMFTNMPTYNFNTQIQQTYLPQIYNNPDMVVGFDALGNNVTYGQILSRTNDQTSYAQAFNTVVNPTFEQKNQIQKDFLTDQFQNIGFTPKEEDINSLIVDNPGGNQALIDAAKTVSFREIAAQENYQLSDAVLANLLKPGSGINTADQFRAYVDPLAVTAEEAARFLAERDEGAPTQEQLARLMAGTEADALNIAREIDEGRVSAAEVRQAYDVLGLKKPTQADIEKLVGDYAEAELAGRAEANLAEARINSIFEQLDNLSVGSSPEVLDAVNRVRADLLGQLESMGVDVSNIAQQVSGVSGEVAKIKTDLIAEIQNARDAGLQGDAALQRAIDAVADQVGTSREDLLAKLGSTETGLRQEFSTQLGAVQTQIGNVESRLTEAINAARQDGLTGDAALQAAINDVATSLGTTKADLLDRLGTTEEALRADFATQLGTVQTQIGDVESRLSQAIEAAKQSGLAGDAALQNAIDSVAASLGTTKADLLAQLGTTESALKADFATQLGSVQQQVADVEDRLAQAIEAAKQAGFTGDEALQNAINNVAEELGTTKADLLASLGTTETALREDFATQLGTIQTQIVDVESRLTQAIQAARQAGLTGDAALQSAINSVSAELGTTKSDVLAQLGTTETALRADFATQLGEVQQQVTDVESRLTAAIAAARQDGLTGDAALQAAINSVSAELGTTKADVLAQLGTTESALRADLATQLGGVQTQITNVENRLTQAIAEAKTAGLTGDAALQDAINKVSGDLGITRESLLGELGKTEQALRQDFATQLGGVQQQVTDVETRLAQAIEDAKQSGLTGDAALQRAIDDVAASLGTTKEGLLAQLGTTEAALREELSTGLAGVSAELQAAYNALSAEQKSLADSILAQGNTLTEALAAVKSGLSGQITDVESRLQKAILDNEAAGLTRDEALQAALDSVSGELGTTRADLLTRLGTTEEAIRAELTSGLAGVSAEVQAAYAALTAEQKALANTLTAQGSSLSDAIAAVQTQTAEQIAGVESRLTSAIAAAEAAGMTRDEALQFAINTVSTELGTTREGLLAQLGTTEAALREEFGAGLAGVSAELQAAYDALSAEQKALADSILAQGNTLSEALAGVQSGLTGQITDVEARLQKAISDGEAAGLTRDQALQTALDIVSEDLGTTRADLLTRLGTTEEALRAELTSGLAGVSAELQAAYDALSAEQKALADSQRAQGATLAEAIAAAQAQTSQQITDVESRFTSALAAAEAAGMSRDQALQQALTDVAADLGTTRADLLSRLGTTEDALRAEFGTGLAGVSAEVKAAYDALSAEQKSLADTLVAQGATLTEAIQSVQASLSGQISGLSADLQAKYDTLTAGQKDIVDRLVQQGDSLTTAINTVSSELSGQIQASAAETQATLLAKMREYEEAGLSRDEAMNRAIGDVSTELGVTRTQLSTQIGRPAVQDDPTTIDVNEAQAPTGIYKIMADYDAAAAQRDLELQEQMEAEALARRIEAQERSSAAQRAQLLGKAPSLLEQGMAGILPFLGAAAVAPDEGAKFKSPFITSKTGQEEFEGSLEEFQRRVAETEYTNPEFGDPRMQEFMGMPQNTEQGESMPNYFTYGEQSDIDRMFNPFASAAASFNPFQPMLAAKGGLAVLMANGGYAGGGLPVVHHTGKNRLDFREGAAVSGPGDGQSDDIPAMLADGEYVLDAEIVAALGNGSTKAGSQILDSFREHIRKHKRSGPLGEIPPPAKSPLEYLSMAHKTSRKR